MTDTPQEDQIKVMAQDAADKWADALSHEPSFLGKLTELPSFIADAIRTALDDTVIELTDLADGALDSVASSAKEIERLNTQLAVARETLEWYSTAMAPHSRAEQALAKMEELP